MPHALVIGASGGIGRALAEMLGLRGLTVHTLSRSADGLDITDESSVEAAVATLPDVALDQVWVATGVLAARGAGPERRLDELDGAQMATVLAVNTIGPALLLKHLQPRLARPGRVVFAVLSARLGSIGDNGLGGWTSYRASKAAVNQVVRCAAIEIKRKRPLAVVVALHPGTIPTEMTRAYARGRYTATPEACADQLLEVLDGLTPDQTGGFFAYDGSPIPW